MNELATAHGLELLMAVLATALALWFRPLQALRAPALRNPWLAALVLLPWLWALQRVLPGALPVQLSGACLLVLMFGWPLAVITLWPVALAGAWLAGQGPWHALVLGTWNGIVPATLALLIGLATRRWLPRHLMVYILARGFLGTAVAATLGGWLWLQVVPPPVGTEADTLMLGRLLMAWGEAFTTGALAAIFVAFRPQWLATYSDARYLPVQRR
jgi:uncharacterized membrane protein